MSLKSHIAFAALLVTMSLAPVAALADPTDSDVAVPPF